MFSPDNVEKYATPYKIKLSEIAEAFNVLVVKIEIFNDLDE